MNLRIRIGLIAILTLLASACASSGSKSAAQPEQTASERALARWQAIIDGKSDLAYEFLTPGVRSTKTREAYATEQARKPVRYLSVKPYDEVCEGDACTVSVEVVYELAIPLPGAGKHRMPAVLEERWIRLEGGWFHLPDTFR
jgi:hypothetical protein